MIKALLLGLLLLGTNSARAAVLTSKPVPTASASLEGLGVELASVLNSEDLTRAQMTKMFEDTLPKQFAANPDFVELEALYPGVSAAVIAAMRPVLINGVLPTLPALWARIGAVYARDMTESELRASLAFYKGPTGRRIIALMGQNSDFSRVIKDTMAPGGQVTADALSSGSMVGIATLGRSLTAVESAAAEKFGTSPVGAKIASSLREVQEIAAQWANEPDPAAEANIEAVVVDTIRYYQNRKGAE